MTLAASFVWKNPDSTRDLNRRLERVVQRGFVYNCQMAPAPTGLFVNVDPGVAVSFDGMTVVEDQQQTLPVAANTNNYVCLYAKYNFGGSPATPTLQWQVMTEAAYLGFGDKDYLIVVGRVDVPPAVSSVLSSYIYYDVRDEVNPLGRDWYRGRVATPAALPAPPPNMNRVGDFYYVDSDNTFFFWNGTIWEPLNTGSYNTETSVANQQTIQAERDRILNGSGVLAGIRPNTQGDFASDTEVNIIETPSVADQIGIDSFTALINGHFIETFGQYVTMDPKPGIPGSTRYDIIFLEMWREDITVPETHGYERNPDGSFTYTMDEVQDKLDQLGWKAGITAAPVADNFNLNPIEARDHAWRVTKWQLGYRSNMPSSVCLYNPAHPTISGACLNVDGNPFVSQPAGTGTDDRIWWAPSTTGVDGYSYAIPLLVVNRTNDEDFTTNDAVKVFRDGERFVFPVYPIADTEHAARKALDTIYRDEPTPFGLDHYPYDEPSGFLSGMDFQIEGQTTPNELDLYEDQVHVRIRGIDDWIKNTFTGPRVDLGVPPNTIGSWSRSIVYLKMNVTLYDNATSTSTRNQVVSGKHFPYLPSTIAGNLRSQGWKRGFVTWEFVSESLGASADTDEYDAMTAAGWTRGDLSMTASGAQYEDGGIWSRAIAIDEDNRIHPYEMEWAIPVVLVHRRNTQPWDFSTNSNGSTGRPDGRTDATLTYQDDLVDLRHQVGLSESEYDTVLEQSLDATLKGKLRTRLGEKYLGIPGSWVAGSRILQTDYIGAAVGAFNLTAPDGMRKIWSDAKEFQVVSFEFDLTFSSSGPLYNYSVAGNTGTLTIKAPPGAHLVRHTPASLYAVGDNLDSEYLDFLGPPCWSTMWDTNGLSNAYLRAYDPTTHADTPVRFYDYNNPGVTTLEADEQPFKINAVSLDDQGRATEMIGYIDTSASAGTGLASYWVHYDRTFTGPYAANYGLGEIPDEVHEATFDPGGTNEKLHIGPIYTTMNVTVAAATTATITSADVQAATGTPGTVVLVGINVSGARSEPDWGPVFDHVTLNAGLNTLTIHFSAAYTGTFSVEVFYQSDIQRWIEVGRGGKSVQAIFTWGKDDTIDLGATPPSVSTYTLGLDGSTWNPLAIGPDVTMNTGPFLWTKAAPASDWTLAIFAPSFAQFPYSNTLNLTNALASLSQYCMVIWPQHDPLASGDKIQIDYTYTPYQGLSSNGGAVATVPQAVTDLKSMLHGKIEGNTDFLVTQTGPSSFFSGVNTFTGSPASNMAPYQDTYNQSLGADRMSMYNRTGLVTTDAPYGTKGIIGNLSSKEKYALNAAAVLRLPFPMNPSMLSVSTSNYHAAVMEFDLDPARAGASAGYINFAPGYPNSNASPPTSPLYPNLSHQYVNGLAPLRVAGGIHAEDKSYFNAVDRYGTGIGVGGTQNFDGADGRYLEGAGSGDIIYVYLGLDASNQSMLLMRTMTPMTTDESCGTGSTYAGTLFYRPITKDWLPFDAFNTGRYTVDYGIGPGDHRSFWTASKGFTSGVARDYIFCTSPGTVLEYYRGDYSASTGHNLLPIMKLQVEPDAVTAKLYGTEFTLSTNDDYYVYGFIGSPINKMVDLVRMPMGAYQVNPNGGLYGAKYGHSASGSTQLTGRTVEYPDNWSGSTQTKLEGLIQAASNGKGGGRGLYLGSTEDRYNMPMLVPGSGTDLRRVTYSTHTVVDAQTECPDTFPSMPGESLFDQSNVTYIPYDIGGPIAYVCYGTLMRPESPEHKNKMVMQITGGPTGGLYADTSFSPYSPEDLDGTALDAFWPIGRPIFKAKK